MIITVLVLMIIILLSSDSYLFQRVAVTVDGGLFGQFFKIDVYEILIDLTETSSRYTYHGDEKSGSTLLFIFHFIGVDYELVTFQIGRKG